MLIKYIKSVLWRVVKRLSQYTGRTVPKGLNVLEKVHKISASRSCVWLQRLSILDAKLNAIIR